MGFPSAASGGLRYQAPLLFTANGSVAVPSNARFLHAFLVAGGGGGAVKNATASTACGATGGGGGGSVYMRVNVAAFKGNMLPSLRPTLATLVVGAGGTSVSIAAITQGNGGTGGSSSLSLTGGLSVTVTGGAGGANTTTSIFPGRDPGGTTQTFYQSCISPEDAVVIRSFAGAPQTEGDAHTGMSSACLSGGLTATVSSENVQIGGVVSSFILLPWWVQAAGITSLGTLGSNSSAGAGTGHVATHGGGGYNGVSGSGATSNTVGATGSAGTGYGSGGGGASGVGTSTTTSGAGAPGCIVIMFEVEG